MFSRRLSNEKTMISKSLSFALRGSVFTVFIALLLVVGTALPIGAQSELTITALAGAAPGWEDGIGAAARFQNPFGVAADGNGNVYVADYSNNTIRKIVVATGEVTTLAGRMAVGSVNGIGASALFNHPAAIAVDDSGNLLVVDCNNHTLRKIVASTGEVTTLAGVPGVSGSSDGTGVAARFFNPFGVAVDGNGNVFVADTHNHTIRKFVIASGEVTTLAGISGGQGSEDGIGAVARFNWPIGITSDRIGNVYIADTNNHTIRKILVTTGEVTTLAGTTGVSGSADGNGVAARFANPMGITTDGNGNVFVADNGNDTIRKIVVATGEVTTLAGTAGAPGITDGTGEAARFLGPSGVAFDGVGNIFVADTHNHTIRKIVIVTREVTTLAGTAGGYGSNDGAVMAAKFFYPQGTAADHNGRVFVADTNNGTIRQIVIATGEVTTLAGKAGVWDSKDGIGAAARFSGPSGITEDGNGNLYIADTYNHTIRKLVVETGEVTTLAGVAGSIGFDDGIGVNARFNNPVGVATDISGNVFVADTGNNIIRRIVVATGEVSTLAGTAGVSGFADGIGAAASFSGTSGVAADGSGNVLVADYGNYTVRKIVLATGEVTTLAGSSGVSGYSDGIGATARFNRPFGIVADGSGNVFVTDNYSCTIRKIVIGTGEATTPAGIAGPVGSADGTGAAARFNQPHGIAVDGSGNLFIADTYNNTIRRSWPALADRATIDVPTAQIGVQRQLDTSHQTATSWHWHVIRRPSGGTAQLSNPALRNPTFTPDRADRWEFRLTASGPSGKSISYVTFEGRADVETLAVNKAGTGSGTVTSDPVGIACGATCSAAFPTNTVVTLSAVASTGSIFSGWTGEGCSGTGSCVVTMDQARTVTANFACNGEPGAFALTSPTPAQSFPAGTSVVDLAWESATNTESYDVYFGPVDPPPLVESGVTDTTTQVTVFDGQHYFWHVLAHSGCSTTWSTGGRQTFSVQQGAPSPGLLDLPFAPELHANGSINAFARQGDGKIVIGGTFTQVNYTAKSNIARLNSDGTIDTTFEPGTGANGAVNAIALQPDGKMVIGGSFSTFDQTPHNYIVRLNANGAVDPNFDTGTGPNWTVYAICVQADGKVVISGNFTTVNGTTRSYFARLNADGSLDITFDPGTGANSYVNAIAMQPDGKILIAGQFTSFNGTTRNRIACINADGSLDTTFDPGTGANSTVNTVALQTDGKIVIGGSFTSFNGTTRSRIARLNANGSLDATFNPGTGANSTVSAVALQSDGKVLVGGYFTSINGTARIRIARLNANGTLDTSFDPGTGVGGSVNAVVVQPDGNVIIGGAFTTVNGSAQSGIARLVATGALDPTFAGTSVWTAATVSAIAVQPDSKILIGGTFTSVNNTVRNNIARLNADGGLDTSFDPGMGAGGSVSTLALQPDGKIVIGGSFTSYNNTTRNRIARLFANGSLDMTFTPGTGANNTVYTAAVQPNGKVIIGGRFYVFNGTPRNYIARLNADGTLDGTFDPGSGMDGQVNALALQPDGKVLVGGMFSTVNGTPRNYLARVNQDGTLDDTFDTGSGPNAYVTTVNLQSDGKVIIGGAFTWINGTARNSIARLNTDGALDGTFDPGTGPDGQVDAIALQADGKIVIGGMFNWVGLEDRNSIARLNSDGSLDTVFAPGFGPSDGVKALALQVNGRILVGGSFLAFNGYPRWGLARLLGEGFTLNTSKTGTGTGIIASIPAGIDCGATCSTEYGAGTHVTLIATPLTGAFTGWSGGCTGTGACIVAMDEAKSVSAAFNLQSSYTLTVGKVGNGVGIVTSSPTGITCGASCAADYAAGTVVTLTPTTDPSSDFVGWSGACSGTGACVVIMDGGRSVTAAFTLKAWRLSVAKLGEGTGTVTSVQTGIVCGPTCAASFDHGALVSLTPTADSGASFAGWSGACSGGGACSVTMDQARIVSAIFACNVVPGAFTLASPTPAQSYPAGTTSVDLTWDAAPGATSYDVYFGLTDPPPSYAPGLAGTSVTVNVQDGRQYYWVVLAKSSCSSAWNTGGRQTFSVQQGAPAPGLLELPFAPELRADGIINAMAVQGDGKIVIGGSFTSINNTACNNIARLNADGTLDSTFHSGTGPNGALWALAVQGDGKILVGGFFTSVNGITRNCIARLNANGTLDTSFNLGSGASGVVFALALQPDGKVLLGGNFSSFNGTARYRIARLNADGALDATFDPGAGANNAVRTLALLPDGKVVIGGSFTTINSTVRNRIARLNTDGALDGTFDPGTGANSSVMALAVQSDNKIIISGDFTTINTTACNFIGRLNANGALDGTFNVGTGANNTVVKLALQPDGKAVIGGLFAAINGAARNGIARLNTDGALDGTFDPGSGVSKLVGCLAQQSDGKIIISGYFSPASGPARSFLTRLNSDGALDGTFSSSAGAASLVNAFATQPDRRILVGGAFETINGTVRSRIARINADGTLDETFDPGAGLDNSPGAIPSNSTKTIGVQSDGKVVIGGTFTSINGAARGRFARLNANGTFDAAFGPGIGINGDVYALTLQSDGKVIIAGSFWAINGVSRYYIARLNADGTHDTTFNPGSGANNYVYAVALQPDGKVLIGGDFTSINGSTSNRIARLNADGTLDGTFNSGTGANSGVRALVLQPDGKVLVAGNFTTINGTVRNRIARLNADGTLDGTFDPGSGANNMIYALALQPDGKIIIGGSFISYNGAARNNLARLNANGSLDGTFDPGSGPFGVVQTVAVQTDGRILVGGSFPTYNGYPRPGVARLLGNSFTLDVSTTGTGTGRITSTPGGIDCGATCSADYAVGTLVTLTATVQTGAFTGWSGACTGTGSCVVTMDAAKSVSAAFDLQPSYPLTVIKTGSGTGTVTSDPAGIDCGATCTASLAHGSLVTLTAAAAGVGSIFTGWSGEGCSGTGACQVTMDRAKTIAVRFVRTWALDVTKTGSGTGSVSSAPAGINCGTTCSALYGEGTEVTLTATVFTGAFGGWSGACSGTGVCVVTMDAVKSVTANFASTIPSEERNALIALYNSTNGAGWSNRTNWRNVGNTDFNAPGTECTWYGVTCDGEGSHVTEVGLRLNNLFGPLPAELALLLRVGKLDFYRNRLSGDIPDLSTLILLQHINLDYNYSLAAGPIPDWLAGMTSLVYLNLNYTQRMGTIPDLHALTNLQTLILSRNGLSGSIPDLHLLSNLQTLNLGENSWLAAGPIPDWVMTITSLKYADFSYTNRTGPLPASLGDLAQLQNLNLGYNGFTGTVPAQLGNLANLQTLDLYHNTLTGSIPIELGAISQLQNLNLNDNQLTGSIPTQLSNLANLLTLDLGSNRLTGSIPTQLGNLTNLRFLYLSSNQLSGSIPDLTAMTGLWDLYLNSNQLSGSIPNLSTLPSLTNLNLSNNTNFTAAPIPGWLQTMTQLYSLNLTATNRTGAVPTWLENLTNLRNLYIGSNQLTGSIPPELGNLSNLQNLYLWGNQLTGSIPTQLGNLANLRSLYLSSNQLTGSIPTQLGNFSGLWNLSLSSNQLTGSIPAEFGSLSNLRSLSLNSNQLSGNIPDLSTLTYLSELNLSNNSTLSASPLPSWLQTMTQLYRLDLSVTNRTGAIPTWLSNLTSLRYLYLSSNQLSGSIPDLSAMTGLRSLYLNSNQLSSAIPTALLNLANLYNGWGLDLRWNALYSTDSALTTFLNSKQTGGNWQGTQTIAPASVAPGSPHSTSIPVNWTPISYTGDSGGYQVLYSTTSGGPYTLFGTTVNKAASSLTVTGLNPSTTYYFVVQTVTNPHPNNSNTVTSELSAETSAATLATHTLTVNFSGSGAGTVTSEPAGISCVSNCSASFDSGTIVTLTATPAVGSAFMGWSGDCAGVGTCVVTMNGVKAVTATFAETIPSGERAALIALYNSTNGTEWTNRTNWRNAGDTDFNAPGTECTWSGVTCDAGHTTVQQLSLNSNNMVGTLPASLGTLTNLQILSLYTNQITGSIPPELGILTNLQCLYLDSNQFADSIPFQLGNLTNLRDLYLGSNQLTGLIPPEIGNLTNLRNLSLADNQLTGSIPTQLGNLMNLQFLHLPGNKLTGSIPTWLGTLTNLGQLWLNRNQFTGSIPTELGTLTNLHWLYLHDNQLTGAIPTELGALTNLDQLFLSSNQLTGSIPPELGNLTNLWRLYLNNNQLTGSIPTQLGNLTNLRDLDLSGNQFTGSISTWLGNFTNLRRLFLNSNQFSGSIPTQLQNLTGLWSSGLDLRWNALYSTDSALTTFLNTKQTGGNWQSTQTIAPAPVSPGTPHSTSIPVNWTPITYTGDSGGYQVLYSTTTGGPYTLFGTTANKTASSLTVTGLIPSTTYYFVVQTITNPHANNSNTVTSELTPEISAATLATHTLTVSFSGSGAGTVTSEPAGINCVSNCSASFDSGTIVTLTATPAVGSAFAGWSGEGCSETDTCQVTMDQARLVTATFSPGFVLSVNNTGTGTGVTTSAPSGIDCGSTCSMSFVTDTVVTLTPTASSDSVFTGWSGACIGAGSCEITMNAAKSVTANFNLKGVPTGFYPVSPCRVFDTRNSSGSPILEGGEHRNFDIAGTCGIPAGAKAITGNVTVVNGSAIGSMSIIAGNLTSTLTTTIEIPLSRARANNAVLQLATDGAGTIKVINNSSGTVHLILDVNGYFQ